MYKIEYHGHTRAGKVLRMQGSIQDHSDLGWLISRQVSVGAFSPLEVIQCNRCGRSPPSTGNPEFNGTLCLPSEDLERGKRTLSMFRHGVAINLLAVARGDTVQRPSDVSDLKLQNLKASNIVLELGPRQVDTWYLLAMARRLSWMGWGPV